MNTGTVKWVNDEKKFGFIALEDGTEDVFADYSDITNGAKLVENQKVAFDIISGAKGPQAVNINVL